MLPVTVHQRAAEERVVLCSHPIDHRLPRVLVRSQLQGRSAEAGWLHVLAGLGILSRGNAAAVENLLVALVLRVAPFAADLREEGGETVVVLLAPLLERMVVAAGALNSQTQEQLRRVLQLGRGVFHL